ncbi:hypothetical protein EXIGLDRAFT_596769, partial [Exidia glandulosa HHB12029]
RSTAQISHDLGIKLRTVQRTIQTFNEIGEVRRPKQTRGGRRRILIGELREFILDVVEDRPYTYLDELRDAIQDRFRVKVSLATVWRTLKRLGLTLKRLSVFAAQQVEGQQRAFRYVIGREGLDMLVFADETSIDMRATYRLYGWA